MITHKTIFTDLDGTLIRHHGSLAEAFAYEPEWLPGAQRMVEEWDRAGYVIIITTGRRENMRQRTEEQLAKLGIPYDQLIMGVGTGIRVLVNDCKPSGQHTAFAINVERNGHYDNWATLDPASTGNVRASDNISKA